MIDQNTGMIRNTGSMNPPRQNSYDDLLEQELRTHSTRPDRPKRPANRKKTSGITAIEVAKYITIAAIFIYIVVLMLFTSGSTKSFDEVKKGIEASINEETLAKADTPEVKRYFGLNAADYEGVLYYHAVNNLSAEEVFLVKVKNDSQVAEVKTAVEERLENRKNDFEGYAPEEAGYIDQAVLSVRGKFIFLAVGPDAQKYKEVFSDSL